MFENFNFIAYFLAYNMQMYEYMQILMFNIVRVRQFKAIGKTNFITTFLVSLAKGIVP